MQPIPGDLVGLRLRIARMEAFRATLDEHGFVVIGGALGSAELAALTDAVDTIHRRRGGGTLHELGFLGVDERFVAMVDHPAVLPLVVSVLGWNIYMYHCHLDVHPPLEEPPRWRWHQDGGRQNVELESPRPRLSVKVAWFLTDTIGWSGRRTARWSRLGRDRSSFVQAPR